MIKNEILLVSGSNKLSGLYWQAENPVAIIIMVHGLGEHIARYDHVAEKFTKKNISFLGVDLIGHGNSTGKKGHVNSIDEFYECIDSMLDHLNTVERNLPLILYGHSMGGNITLNYLVSKGQYKFCCAVVTSSWIKIVAEPKPIEKFLARVVNGIYPSLQQPNGLDVKGISSVEMVQEDYECDPLNHDRISVRLFNEMYNKGLKSIAEAHKIKIPLLLAHGNADSITSASGSEEFAAKCPEATLKLWPGLRHETHNEHNKEEVINYYVSWIVDQLNK